MARSRVRHFSAPLVLTFALSPACGGQQNPPENSGASGEHTNSTANARYDGGSSAQSSTTSDNGDASNGAQASNSAQGGDSGPASNGGAQGSDGGVAQTSGSDGGGASANTNANVDAGYRVDRFQCFTTDADGGSHPYACPDDAFPAVQPGHVVANRGRMCIELPGGSRVRCPPEGVDVTLPAQRNVVVGGQNFSYNETNHRCFTHAVVHCHPRPATCNPPPPRPADCPPELLPELRAALAPTRVENGRCFYQSVEVRCR